MGRIVRKTMDEILQDRTASESRLRALADLPDEEIDFSDIPELTEEFWKNARPFREVMEERRARRTEKVTVAIDADVVAWLKRDDERLAESRVNDLLRGAMLEELGKTRRRA
jgi:uncharacterized protein (DUF4415 family)